MNTLSPLFLIPGTAHRVALALCLAGFAGPSHAQQPAPSGSIAELMELGIYSEETKGDLDAAMRAYQQILANAQANQSLAAQALFRLALCHDKKSDLAAATAACEKLIKDYPGEKDLVAAASEYLTDGAALLPAPWGDYERTELDFRLPTGMKAGFTRYTIRRGAIDGRPTWKLESLQLVGARIMSRLDVEASSMKPIHSVWKSLQFGTAETTYSTGKADIKIPKVGERSVELNGVVYDNEEAIQLIRRLPLAVGFKKSLAVFHGMTARSASVEVEVVGIEKIEVPAGSFDCYKIQLKLINGVQTFWFATDRSRALVKIEVGSVSGVATRITNTPDDTPMTTTEPKLGYSVTAPAGWITRPDERPAAAQKAALIAIDDEGTGATFVQVQLKKDFSADALASLRAFSAHQIAAAKKANPTFEVHEDSWKETTIDGQPALSFIADHMTGEIKMIAHVTEGFVGNNTVDICSSVPVEGAEGYHAKHEAIVAGYRNN